MTNENKDIMLEKLIESRTILISGGIDDKSAKEVVQQLLLLDSINHDPIKLIISSPGGHVDSGYLIHDMINFIESEVKIIGAGWVVSAGVLIYLAGKKENRYALPNTRFMIHQPSGGTQGQASNMEITAKEIIRTRQKLNELIARETGKSVEEVEQHTGRDYWLNTQEALDYGIVNKIITNQNEI